MAEEWFYAHDGQEFGPFTTSQLKRLGASGQIRPTDLVWKTGMAKRVPARAVKGLCPEAAKSQTAAAPRSRTASPTPPPEEVVELIAVDSPSTPTQASYSTQVDEVVELTAVESAPPAAPYPPQAQYAQAPLPPVQQPLRGVPVAAAEVVEPYEDDEPRRPRSRRRKQQGGSLLWLWLLLGGVGLFLVVGGVLLLVLLGGSGKVTRQNFEKLSVGMTENDIRGVLGSPSESMDMGVGKTLIWKSGDNVITVVLLNDRAFNCTGVFGGEMINIGGPNFGGPNFGGPNFGGPNFGRPGRFR